MASEKTLLSIRSSDMSSCCPAFFISQLPLSRERASAQRQTWMVVAPGDHLIAPITLLQFCHCRGLFGRG